MAGGTNRGGPGRPPRELRIESLEVYGLLLAEIRNRIERDPNGFTNNELAQAANTTGRLGGLVTEYESPESVRIMIVRKEVPIPDWSRREVRPEMPDEPVANRLLPPPATGPSKSW